MRTPLSWVVQTYRPLKSFVMRVWHVLNLVSEHFSNSLVGESHKDFKRDVLIFLVMVLPVNVFYILVIIIGLLAALFGVISFWLSFLALLSILVMDVFFVGVLFTRYWLIYRLLPLVFRRY